MRVLTAFSISALLFSPFIFSLLVNAQETRSIKVYKPGKHILSPELLPTDFSSFVDPACQGKLSDDAQFAMIVDPMGQPRNIIPTRLGTSGLAPLAAEIAARDRFSVGQKGETSVAVSITIDIHLEGCLSSESSANARQSALAKLPLQAVGPASNLEPETMSFVAISSQSAQPGDRTSAKPASAITSPIPTSTPEAKYSLEARKKKIEGVVLVSIIVDASGSPQNPRILKPLGYGLDEAAIDAVKSYRFKPAMKDGHPVPVMMTIQVNFRLK